MNWIHYSVLMYVFSITLYLALRKLQKKNVPSEINNLLMFSIGSLTFCAIALVNSEINVFIEWKHLLFMVVMTYLCSFLGNKFSLEGIRLAENPGYSLVIQKSYAIYTTFAAILLFGSSLSLKNILSILMVVAFMSIMLIGDKQQTTTKKNNLWIRYSFFAFFAFGNLALASKWLLNQGIDPFIRGFYIQIIVSLMFLMDYLLKSKKSRELKEKLKDKTNYIWFLAIGVSNALFNLFMQYAFEIAPNVGYVNIINASSIAGITLLSALIFKEELTLRKFIGVIGVSIGVILLVT